MEAPRSVRRRALSLVMRRGGYPGPWSDGSEPPCYNLRVKVGILVESHHQSGPCIANRERRDIAIADNARQLRLTSDETLELLAWLREQEPARRALLDAAVIRLSVQDILHSPSSSSVRIAVVSQKRAAAGCPTCQRSSARVVLAHTRALARSDSLADGVQPRKCAASAAPRPRSVAPARGSCRSPCRPFPASGAGRPAARSAESRPVARARSARPARPADRAASAVGWPPRPALSAPRPR